MLTLVESGIMKRKAMKRWFIVLFSELTCRIDDTNKIIYNLKREQQKAIGARNKRSGDKTQTIQR